MANRYVPKEYMVNPKSFGRHPDAVWKKYENKSEEVKLQVAASYLQHLAACQTLTAAANNGWDIPDLHRRIPQPGKVDKLRRRLYGDVPAAFDDIVAWARVVGDVTVLPAPADIERMMPPTKSP